MYKLQFKIFISTFLCVILVALTGTMYLYRYMNQFIYNKAYQIDQLNLTTISNQANAYLENIIELGLECSNDSVIQDSMLISKTQGIKNSRSLNAQNQLNTYLSSFIINDYVDKLLIFNETGLIEATNSRVYGSSHDYTNVLSTPHLNIAQKDVTIPPYNTALTPSIIDGQTTFSALFPVYGDTRSCILGYVYLEIGLDLFSDLLLPYPDTNNLFVTDMQGTFLAGYQKNFPSDIDLNTIKNGENIVNNVPYLFSIKELPEFGIRFYNSVQLPLIDDESEHLMYVVICLLFMAFIIGIILALFTSRILAKPIQRLNHRLQLITQGDFSFDSEIERPNDEIGEIGHTINEMTASFKNLLKNNQDMYRQQRTIEIALLQSQVNPHFLYNTLDSIHWMAVIQKNEGIQEMTRCLSNLLKNLAKGTEDHISLTEEISLVEDYISIQSIRYMGTFEVINNIPKDLCHYKILKFTLQPLIENAIFHGIEPKGTYGTITLTGSHDNTSLYLHILDDGVGIPPEQLEKLLDIPQKHKNKGALSSIGVYNVNQRLKLIYGVEYGLSYKSEYGKYTDVQIKLPLEL